MPEMVTQFSLQVKIAELESRIGALETAYRKLRDGKIRTATPPPSAQHPRVEPEDAPCANVPTFGAHWNKMWDEFHLAMKDVFK